MVKTYDTDDDYLHPRRRVVHEIRLQGAPLLQIFAMDENTDVPEGATLVPPPTIPERVAPGLTATLSVDDKPPEDLAPQERLFIDCTDNPYYDRTTEMLASGYLHVRTAGRYLFEMYSDDCATIWLGKDALVSNVSTVTTQRQVVLSAGYYPMRVEYRNTAGQACLTFRWQPPGATELTEVTAPALLHDLASTDKTAP
jgi:hypothetical protein